MNFITIANKLYLSCAYYLKHNKHAIEWRPNAMINKTKNLINKLGRSKCYPLFRKHSHVPFNR